MAEPDPHDPTAATAVDELMRQVLRRQRAGERLTLELGPHTLLTVVGAVQWAMRRSSEFNAHAPAMLEQFLAAARQALADEPEILALLQLEPAPDVDGPPAR